MSTDAYTIRKAVATNGPGVVGVFNYFVENSLAAYLAHPVGEEFFFEMRGRAAGYPFYVVELDSELIGFAYLHSYHPAPAFRRTGLVTYFILPEHTGHGLGTRLLEMLVEDARSMDVDTLLAHISSANVGSLRFHEKHGFKQCGCFEQVGCKWDRNFDVVWMQRFLGEKRSLPS
jgi:phosphinothricin acetyltransferase